MKNRIIIIIILCFFSLPSKSQLSWIKKDSLTAGQIEAVEYLNDHFSEIEPKGFSYKYKLFYTKGSNDPGSVTLRRTVILPGITIPGIIGGELTDDNRFAFQINPLVGFGLVFRRERITTNLTGRPTVKHPFAIQPMMLFYKYSVDKNRYGAVYGLSLNFLDYIQVGVGYSDRRMPNYNSSILAFIGASFPIADIFPSQEPSGVKPEAR